MSPHRPDGGRTTLLLVGHGSHLNPDSSTPVYTHAEAIRAMGIFDQVLEAFWKEEPSLRDALDLATGDTVYVVPIFLAEGYFTREVVPRELGIAGERSVRKGRTIHYCEPVGTHPAMADMILARAGAISPLQAQERRQSALVIIGHGTERSRTSGGTVYRLVDVLRDRHAFGTVECGFLDEDPRIADVLAAVEEREILLVPFFVAEGWHTSETIPDDLGLDGPLTVRGDRVIRYAPPVGTMPEMVGVILAVARDAGALAIPSAVDEDPRAAALTPPAPDSIDDLAWERFRRWLDGSTGRSARFLDLLITRRGRGWELRHQADGAERDDALTSIAGRRELLDIVRTTRSGRYRPLRTSDDMRTGWRYLAAGDAGLREALSLIYPAAVLHWSQGHDGSLVVLPYSNWAARQSGMYEIVRHLPAAIVQEAIQGCCGSCRRSRAWPLDDPSSPPAEPPWNPDSPGEADVPCREPCTHFATVARTLVSATAAPRA